MRAKHKKRVRIRWGRFLLSLFVLIAIVFAGLLFWPIPSDKPANTAAENNTNSVAPVVPDPVQTEFSMLVRCAGDIMAHGPQLTSALKKDGTYDFTENYEFVSKYFKEADLSMANFETTFSGDGKYTGYPAFDSPEKLAQDVFASGIHTALFANNHMLDSRLKGARNTVNVLRQSGFSPVVGARAETSEPRAAVTDVNGLKVGIIAYTYETRLVDGRRTMNGSYMDSEAPNYINSFRYTTGSDKKSHINQDDLNQIKGDLDWCRENGAEVIICYFHWGTEYKQTPDNADKELAQFVAENGADIIFASHPHVLQPIDIIEIEVDYPVEEPKEEPEPEKQPEPEEEPKKKESFIIRLRKAVGLIKEEEPEEPEPVITPEPVTEPEPKPTSWTKTVPVFWSLGNFVSNQRYESLSGTYGEAKSRLTEQGMIGNVKITYNRETGEIVYDDISCIPTWVDRYASGGRNVYKIIPLIEDLDSNPVLQASKHASRAKTAFESIKKLVGEEYIYSGN